MTWKPRWNDSKSHIEQSELFPKWMTSFGKRDFGGRGIHRGQERFCTCFSLFLPLFYVCVCICASVKHYICILPLWKLWSVFFPIVIKLIGSLQMLKAAFHLFSKKVYISSFFSYWVISVFLLECLLLSLGFKKISSFVSFKLLFWNGWWKRYNPRILL